MQPYLFQAQINYKPHKKGNEVVNHHSLTMSGYSRAI